MIAGARRPLGATAVLALALALLAFASPAAADEGWIIERFASDIEVQRDGRLLISETIDVDFQRLTDRHGIFRDIPVRYRWDPDTQYVRRYFVVVLSVRDADGRGLTFETSRSGANYRIKIGDADRFVQGKQTYRIRYVVSGVLNALPDHDELFWNVNGGDWPVAMRSVSATVHASFDAFTAAACFQGQQGSKEACQSSSSPQRAAFSATRALPAGEQLTVVAAIRRGVVSVPAPMLERREREVEEYFDVTPWTLGGALVAMFGGLGLVVWRWWTAGRDRPEHETIVPEFEPPEKLRPAQVGLLLDERADTKDVTATIVDLAVRGHLTISELESAGLFAKKDWLLTRRSAGDTRLEAYERTILEGLFSSGDEVKLSELREKFYTTLAKAQRQLYADAVKRRWFPADPQKVRIMYGGLGVAALIGAGLLVFFLGVSLGAGIVGLGAIVPAVALMAVAPRMPRKTRAGAELLRRAQGFRRYMEVAETERQRFAERENIFAEYLPYAIVFGVVSKWARAFSDIDARAATAGWYVGSSLGAFSANDLSSDLSSFSNVVSSAIASTPGGSGGSGFSGGGAGAGGGGGGGGSW